MENQFEKAKHGYVAREPHEEVHIPMLPSVSSIMDTDRSMNQSFLMNTFRSNNSKHTRTKSHMPAGLLSAHNAPHNQSYTVDQIDEDSEYN